MQFESNFECLSFDPFSLQENFMNNECDPDVNFYQNNSSNVEANYFLLTEVKSSFASFDPNSFSVLHFNIRNMKKNFENFREFLKNLSVSFSAICLSETWCESQDESQNSNYGEVPLSRTLMEPDKKFEIANIRDNEIRDSGTPPGRSSR